MDFEAVEQFAGKVATDQAVSGASVLAYIGDRLGIWPALARTGAVTAGELAALTGLDPHYTAEWLATETAAGYLTYDPATGRFLLPPEHAAVLASDDSPAALGGGFELIAGLWSMSDRTADAFRTGAGISWGDQDERVLRGVARYFGPVYARSLVPQWLPAADGLVERLEAGARVLDVGCGFGTSTILMAQAFPRSTFLGLEPETGSVAQARRAADERGVGDRAAFQGAPAGTDVGGGWDLVCFFDAFHHVADPAATARWARGQLADDGWAMLVEPLAHDRLEDNLTPVGLTFYGASTLLCVPDALAQDAVTVLGGQAGPTRLCGLLRDAGFRTARIALESDANLVIEARP